MEISPIGWINVPGTLPGYGERRHPIAMLSGYCCSMNRSEILKAVALAVYPMRTCSHDPKRAPLRGREHELWPVETLVRHVQRYFEEPECRVSPRTVLIDT
jgi:hypothetical protein